ncbi:MAG: hypothetical protein RML56_01435 [Burkholderiales bacterium]|nr:hypothetical protein [Burkholderiales bacterium]
MSPATFSASTATTFERSGTTRTATSAESSETNTRSLPGSVSVVLPSAIAATGKSRTCGVPSIESARFFSFIAACRRDLTKSPSTITKTAPTATSARASSHARRIEEEPQRLHAALLFAFATP